MSSEVTTGTTRDRLIEATARLLSEKGPSGTGTAQILETGNAPRGSFYFHFPDGKDELVRAAVESAGAATLRQLRQVFEADLALPDRVERYFQVVANGLSDGDFQFGCAVGATALDLAAVSMTMQDAIAGVFGSWIATIADHLRAGGVEDEPASVLATTFVSTLEGATMLARALRSTAPLHAAGQTLRAATLQALGR